MHNNRNQNNNFLPNFGPNDNNLTWQQQQFMNQKKRGYHDNNYQNNQYQEFNPFQFQSQQQDFSQMGFGNQQGYGMNRNNTNQNNNQQNFTQQQLFQQQQLYMMQQYYQKQQQNQQTNNQQQQYNQFFGLNQQPQQMYNQFYGNPNQNQNQNQNNFNFLNFNNSQQNANQAPNFPNFSDQNNADSLEQQINQLLQENFDTPSVQQNQSQLNQQQQQEFDFFQNLNNNLSQNQEQVSNNQNQNQLQQIFEQNLNVGGSKIVSISQLEGQSGQQQQLINGENYGQQQQNQNLRNMQQFSQKFEQMNLYDRNSESQEFKEKNMQVLFRSNKGTFLQKFDVQGELKEENLIDKNNLFAFFSNDGNFLYVAGERVVSLYDLRRNNMRIAQTERSMIQKLYLSNDWRYIISVELPKKTETEYFCYLLDPFTLEVNIKFQMNNYSKLDWPLVQFDEKDKLFFIKKKEKIDIIDSQTFNLLDYIELPDFKTQFYLSPKYENLQIMIIQPETSTQEQGYIKGKLTLYKYDHDDQKLILICEKELQRAQEITPIWSPDGEKLLIWKQTMHDNTNQSYYGQHTLYYFEKETKNLREIYLYKGPIHDIQWNKQSTQFIVSVGYMPAGTILFGSDGYPQFEFGKHHKNCIKWANQRYMLVAGFGNLNGHMDIWDTIEKKLVGSCRSHGTTYCQWSPCSQKFLIGVLQHKLKQDNKMVVYNLKGQIIGKILLKDSEHLYQVTWRPDSYIFKDNGPLTEEEKKEENTNSVSEQQNSEDTNQQKEKKGKFLSFRNNSSFAAQLKAQKEQNETGPRILEKDEKFDSQIEDPKPEANQNKDDKKNNNNNNSNNNGQNRSGLRQQQQKKQEKPQNNDFRIKRSAKNASDLEKEQQIAQFQLEQQQQQKQKQKKKNPDNKQQQQQQGENQGQQQDVNKQKQESQNQVEGQKEATQSQNKNKKKKKQQQQQLQGQEAFQNGIQKDQLKQKENNNQNQRE